jgi:hypothetical protein
MLYLLFPGLWRKDCDAGRILPRRTNDRQPRYFVQHSYAITMKKKYFIILIIFLAIVMIVTGVFAYFSKAGAQTHVTDVGYRGKALPCTDPCL